MATPARLRKGRESSISSIDSKKSAKKKREDKPALLKNQAGKLDDDEVDYVMEQVVEMSDGLHLVLWKDYPPSQATWEKLLNGPLVEEFLLRKSIQDEILRRKDWSLVPHKSIPGRKVQPPVLFNWNYVFALADNHHVAWKWLAWERGMREAREAAGLVDGLKAELFVENWFDDEKPPQFKYIVKNRMTDAAREMTEKNEAVGMNICECEGGACKAGARESECCCDYVSSGCYDERGRLFAVKPRTDHVKMEEELPLFLPLDVYECSSQCGCDPNKCHRRVLQRGRTVTLMIFRDTVHGWTLRAGEDIPRGAFICEKMGEYRCHSDDSSRVLSADERAHRLAMAYRYSSYRPLVLDCTKYGNESRFIRYVAAPPRPSNAPVPKGFCPSGRLARVHSAAHHGQHMHRVGVYAARDIAKGEEITLPLLRPPPRASQKRENRSRSKSKA